MSQSPDGKEGSAPSSSEKGLVRQLEAAEERLLVVLGLTDGVVFEFDEQGRYLAIWTRSDALLAAPREALLGRTITDVLGPEAAAPFLERIQLVLSTGQSACFEYSLEVVGGLRWFSADAVALPPGRNVGFLVRDITHHKEMEQRLMQADRQAELVTLAAGVANEVNNPLGYVSANLGLAVEELEGVLRALKQGGADPAGLERSVREVMDALSDAQQGTRLIRQLVGDLLKTFVRERR